MTDRDKAALHEACAHLKTERDVAQRMEMLIAKALAASQKRQRPSEQWEDQAMELLRVIQQDRKEKSHV